jgi:hypothetical protein
VLGGRSLLATGGRDGTVRLWDPATGAAFGEPLTLGSVSVEALIEAGPGTFAVEWGAWGRVVGRHGIP